MYAPVPHVTVGSKEISRSVQGALQPLPGGEIDPAFTLAKDVLCAADESGFDLVLYAERHLGADFEAWVLASAVSSWTRNLIAMPAVHPGLWHPTLIAKMAACLDRLTTGRSAINLVTGWNEVEAKMFGGDILLHEDDRYIRAEEFVTVLRGMWNETPFSFDGRFYQVKESQLLIKPATRPPVFTASRSLRGLEMVAKYADWWFIDYDKKATDLAGVEDSLRRAIDGMNERAAKYGRKVRFAFNPFVAFGDSDEAALEHAKKLLTPDEPDADVRKIMQRVGPAMKSGCVGRPQKVRDQLMKYVDMGIELFLLKFVPTVDEVYAIRDHIIAPLRSQLPRSAAAE
ncbi:MAG: LLM class flavin-dependent oxidoreductase [Xanthobacteraceae bacterium]